MSYLGRRLPCYLECPQQHSQLDSQVNHEQRVIPLPHAVLDPRAVVIVAADTVLAHLAVLGSHGLLHWTTKGRKAILVTFILSCIMEGTKIHPRQQIPSWDGTFKIEVHSKRIAR